MFSRVAAKIRQRFVKERQFHPLPSLFSSNFFGQFFANTKPLLLRLTSSPTSRSIAEPSYIPSLIFYTTFIASPTIYLGYVSYRIFQRERNHALMSTQRECVAAQQQRDTARRNCEAALKSSDRYQELLGRVSR